MERITAIRKITRKIVTHIYFRVFILVCGSFLIIEETSWLTLLGLFLLTWCNNLELREDFFKINRKF